MPSALREFGRVPSNALTCARVPMSTALYPLASISQIEKTPSREDGIPDDLEHDLSTVAKLD